MVFSVSSANWHKGWKLLKTSIQNNKIRVRKIMMEKNNRMEENPNHIYKKRMTKFDAVTYIVNNIVHKNDDFIVTSKPYGVGSAKSIAKLESYIPHTFETLHLTDILPEVAKKLGYKLLRPAKVPEKFASGVMILAVTDLGCKKIKDALKRSIGKLKHSYYAITVGCPSLKDTTTKFGIKIPKNTNESHPIVLNQWSKKSVKKKDVRLVSWQHNVLSQSDLAALVKVNISNTHKNSLKLYLATKCLSPVLGDWIFSCRVLDMFGVPLLLNQSTETLQSLNPKLLSLLQVLENERKIIPCHVHLNSLTILLKKNTEITFSVPPPETFIWTCNQLNLKLPL